jgi:hypothetical protein
LEGPAAAPGEPAAAGAARGESDADAPAGPGPPPAALSLSPELCIDAEERSSALLAESRAMRLALDRLSSRCLMRSSYART